MAIETTLEDTGKVVGEEKEKWMSLQSKQVQTLFCEEPCKLYTICLAERPRYKENEEACTGLCLIKKIEAIEAKMEKKKKTKNGKKVSDKAALFDKPQPKKDTAPCTGMCALMRQRTGQLLHNLLY